MAEGYRCQSCGMYHIGALPDMCPMCGANQKYLIAYEGPGDLAGTKTMDNLKAAFAGESQANRRYQMFSTIARLEGKDAVAEVFDRAAAEETAHALGELAYMGAFADTLANLEAAMAGEQAEYEDMYKRMADEAKEEGFTEIASFFRALGRAEFAHHQSLSSLLPTLKAL